MTEAASVRERTDRRIDTFGAIGVTLGILGVGFVIFGYSPALLASLYVGMAAPYVAIPYTAIAVIAPQSTDVLKLRVAVPTGTVIVSSVEVRISANMNSL